MTSTRSSGRAGPRWRGQALVEFVLVFPIWLLIVMGLIDGGRLVFAYNTVAQAAREGARLAAVEAPYIGVPSPCGAPVCPTNTTDFRDHVRVALNRMTIVVGQVPDSTTYISCTTAAGAPTGAWTGGNDCASDNVSGTNVVSVRLTAEIRPMTPVFAILVPQYTLSAGATMALP